MQGSLWSHPAQVIPWLYDTDTGPSTDSQAPANALPSAAVNALLLKPGADEELGLHCTQHLGDEGCTAPRAPHSPTAAPSVTPIPPHSPALPCSPSGKDRTGWMQESSWDRRSSSGASYCMSSGAELRAPHRAHEGLTSQLHRARLFRWTWAGGQRPSASHGALFARCPVQSALILTANLLIQSGARIRTAENNYLPAHSISQI